MTTELRVKYGRASTVTADSLRLATELDRGAAVYFDGFATHPVPTARALAAVAEVAATRYYEPSAMIAARIRAADPVVTAEDDRLRFESFSLCAGVHARLDLVEDGLDVRAAAPGTTNVDFNPPVRAALSKLTRRDPLRLTVGPDAVTVETLDDTVVERRVPLPERWVKGFGEVQVALADGAPVLELGQVAARRFLDALPGGALGKTTAWAVPAAGAVRLASAWRPGAVCVAGTGRLRLLQPLARSATGLRAYADPDATTPSAVAWVVSIPGGRISLTLSPEPSRGFSGEGGLLLDLVSAAAEADAPTLLDAMVGRTRFTLQEAAAAAGVDERRAAAALTRLGAHGHLGFDAAEQAYFLRHLPYPDELLRADPPRLRDARELAAAGAVRPHPDGGSLVTSGRSEYRAVLEPDGFRCTCPWSARHGTSRGPCKHVLAVALSGAADGSEAGFSPAQADPRRASGQG